jgi:hypothetical protein
MLRVYIVVNRKFCIIEDEMSLKSYKQYLEDMNHESNTDSNGEFLDVFSKIVEDRPEEIRRLVQKSMSAGVFDNDPDLLARAKKFHTQLSSGKVPAVAHNTNNGMNAAISRPAHDDPANNPVTESYQSLKEDMVNFLKNKFRGLLDVNSQDFIFDAEAAIYWFATDYHHGIASELYSILSSSKYRPGRAEGNIMAAGEVAKELYDALVEQYS